MKIKLIPRIKECRERANLTQKELANKINSDTTQLSRFENNRNKPSAEMLWRIGIGIGCKVDELYDYEIVE